MENLLLDTSRKVLKFNDLLTCYFNTLNKTDTKARFGK